MSKLSRILFALAAALFSGMLVLPIWSISLIAPQYPEGLGMVIRANTIEGAKEYDLKNINDLNHYIGMKIIEPDAIPELELLPWIIGGLVVAGLLVAMIGNRKVAWGWVTAVILFAIAGMADFYRWSYDYGHNLDSEHAIIKVPGMVYQPPILGVKQILNFTASSWPASGTYFAVASVALALFALLVIDRGRRPASASARKLEKKAQSARPRREPAGAGR